MIKSLLIKQTYVGQLRGLLLARRFCQSLDGTSSSGSAPQPKEPTVNQIFFESGNETRDEFMTEEQMFTYKEKNFIDRVRLHVYGGKGGAGCVAHLKDHRGLKGRASGGSGGHGGSVYIRASMDEKDLSYIKSKHVRGNNGRDGKGDVKPGRNGKDIHFAVPVGTVVHELVPILDEKGELIKQKKGESTLDCYNRYTIADLSTREQEVQVAKGGKGGKGNMNDNMIKERLLGTEGQYRLLLLELKIIADIGFVGMPNAGKSTLLASLTRCKPKIAPYAFTTLSPNIGKLRFIDDKAITLADIPGLIEGSSVDKGLGFEFLKHVEKSKTLCYVIDMSNTHEKKPWDQFEILKKELSMYSSALANKDLIVVGNKCDLKGAFVNYEEFKRRTGVNPIMVSAKNSEGMEDLVIRMREIILGNQAQGL